MLGGGFNASTACNNDLIDCDCALENFDNGNYIPDLSISRHSEDKESNSVFIQTV